jgi:hypothetical protein
VLSVVVLSVGWLAVVGCLLSVVGGRWSGGQVVGWSGGQVVNSDQFFLRLLITDHFDLTTDN